MRNIFSRPMFRNPNVRNDMLRGIMASGPELIRASYQQPKPKTIGETAREIKDFITVTPFKPAAASTIGQAKAAENYQKSFGEEEVSDATELFKQDKIKAEKAEKERLDKLKKIEDEDPDADTEPTPDSLFKPFLKTDDTGTGTGTDTTTTQFNFRDIKNKTAEEIKNIQTLYSQYSTDLNNLNSANILGKTYDKHKEEYIAALNKRPEEATFEDVRDSAFDLLGFDRDSLDEKLTKDQQGSIWLNMMRAGLAMAAGESPNALTNVAKGFQIGLEGYGRDMKGLTDDYRKDIEKHQNTMYRLLKDKNSENIAKNALDVQRKAAEFSIIQQTRGEERKDLLDKLNTEVTMRKLKIESMSTLANYDLEKFKLDKSSAEFNELLEIKKAQIAGLLPEEITAAIGQGLVRVKDPSKLMTADNIELTEKGVEQEFDLVKSLKEGKAKYRPSESMQKIKIQGRKGGFGLKAKPGEELSDQVQQELGLTLQNLTKSTSPFMKALDPIQGSPSTALEMLITAYRPLKDKGVILEYNSLPESIKNAIEAGDEETVKTYQNNTNLFVGSP